MSEKQQISDAENQHYDAEVAEAVDKISSLDGGDKVAAAEGIIQDVVDNADLHKKGAMTFRGEVLQKVAERKRMADDEREQKIIEKFEGQVVTRGEELRFAGIDKDARFYVRAGSLFRRIFGKRFKAPGVDKLLREVQDLEDNIERNQKQLDMLRAAKEESSHLLRSTRKIWANKRASKGWISTDMDLIHSFKTAWRNKRRHKAEYKQGGKKKIAEINKKSKKLDQQKSVLDALREKVNDRRDSGKEIFEENFGQQVDVLKSMTGDDRKQEENRLRIALRNFGKDSGIMYMEYFLNEALGITPKTAKARLDGDTVTFDEKVYLQPQTEREVAKENVKVARWAKGILGKDLPQGELTALIALLRDKAPEKFIALLKGKTKNKEDKVLRVLFSGRHPSKNRKLLVPGRMEKVTPDNLLKYFKLASSYTDNTGELEDALITFAEKWPSEYAARDFDFVYSHIISGVDAPKGRELQLDTKDQKKLAGVWENVTGDILSDRTYFSQEFTKEMAAGNKSNAKKEMKAFYKNDRAHALMAFFYRGEFNGDSLVTKKKLLYSDKGAKHFVLAYKQAKELLDEASPKSEVVKKIFKKLKKNSKFKTDGMSALDASLFKKLYEAVKKDEKAKKKTPPPGPVAGPPAPVAGPPAPVAGPPAPVAGPPAPVIPGGGFVSPNFSQFFTANTSPGASTAPKPSAAPKASTAPSTVDTPQDKGRKTSLRKITGIVDPKKLKQLYESLPDDFDWKSLRIYAAELKFFITGYYRRGKVDKSLDKGTSWKLFEPSKDTLVELLGNIPALKKFRKNPSRTYNESGYTESAISFFRRYLIQGLKRDISSPVASAGTPATKPTVKVQSTPTSAANIARSADYQALDEDQKLFADGLMLDKDIPLVRKVCRENKDNAAVMEALKDKETIAKMHFFITSEYGSDINLVRDSSGKKGADKRLRLKRNVTQMQALVDITPKLKSLSEDAFEDEINAFFTSNNSRMYNFIKHIDSK